jgi:regulator of protease activity HflC (stomatin/prohibitin superfamily)
VYILKDAAGLPIIRKQSPLDMYHVEVLQFVIKDIDFDDTINKLIAQKKEAEQMKVVSKANAEKAAQDAITAKAQGEAKIAIAKAEKEVEKMSAVTTAMKEFEVAELNKKRDAQNAEAGLIQQRASAEANRLLVSAGLTPQEQAQFRKDTAIGVAQALSTVKLPSLMVIGGDGKGGQVDPFTAVGLESMMRISQKMVDGQK